MRKLWSARSLVCSHRESMDRPRVRQSFRHGKLIVAAVAHIIWSTLDDTSTYVPLTDPRMPTVIDLSKMPHFDANGGEADAFFVALPVAHLRTV